MKKDFPKSLQKKQQFKHRHFYLAQQGIGRKTKMKRTICLLTAALFCCAAIAVAQSPDPIQGNWEGKFTQKAWKDKPVSAKLIAQGKNGYRSILSFMAADGKTLEAGFNATSDKNVVKAQDSGCFGEGSEVKFKIKDGKMIGKIAGKDAPGAFEMSRVEKKSPTLGDKAPEGAVVLFNGSNTESWKSSDAAKGVMWEIVEGAMEVRKSSILTKQEFGDQKLHLEFRTPFMPDKRGQSRGNSGVYIQGRYEVQVLDSFGLPTADNECGGIYKKAVPKTNACLPPTEWQTYDIVFHAPKYDESGKKIQNAVITVQLNGVVIHDNAELDGATPGGISGDESKTGPLLLQDHNNKVQYRNIWIQQL
jgi:hypothetical protein